MFVLRETSLRPVRVELLCWWWLVALVAAGLPASGFQQSAAANDQSASSNSSAANPYWRRPGCYRVGHTRTISIPGCVKFNLSTNACRGYCMSYSVPASEDLVASPNQMLGQQEAASSQAPAQQQQSADGQLEPAPADSRPASRLSHQLIRQPSSQLFAHDQQGERRDVVSVSQCCNMMETEDVVVNLRCGANEVRRLVFKSAKTCECFFCKHV